MEKNGNKIIISVFGGREAGEEQCNEAEKLGRGIAERGWILLCGGRGGIMEAVCKGCSQAGGLSLACLPGSDRSDANPYVGIPLATGIGFARNQMLACACDAAVAIGGHYGTLSEIAYALQYDKPLLQMDSWDIAGARPVESAEEALRILDDLFTGKENT